MLLKLAELGSVQRTADAIGMTQSSVTQTLAYLERLLDTQLFQRHARGVRPTPACQDLLPVARNLLLGIAEGAEAIASRQHQGQGLVRLIASAAATNGLLVKALAAFNEQSPRIKISLQESEGEDQLLAIGRGEVDLVACRKPLVIPEGWQFQELMPDRYAVVCAAGHRLAQSRRVKWADLASETWLTPPAGSAARERFDTLALEFPKALRTYAVITRALPMVWWLLRERGLVALLPLSFVQPLIDGGGLAEIRVGQDISMEPLGLLQPTQTGGEAATQLGLFLANFFAGADAHRGASRAGTRKSSPVFRRS